MFMIVHFHGNWVLIIPFHSTAAHLVSSFIFQGFNLRHKSLPLCSMRLVITGNLLGMCQMELQLVCGIFIFSTIQNHKQGVAALHMFLRAGKGRDGLRAREAAEANGSRRSHFHTSFSHAQSRGRGRRIPQALSSQTMLHEKRAVFAAFHAVNTLRLCKIR